MVAYGEVPHAVMDVLENWGPQTIKELSTVLPYDRTRVANAIHYLRRVGFVEKISESGLYNEATYYLTGRHVVHPEPLGFYLGNCRGFRPLSAEDL